MSGHSKWHSIKHKKAAQDAKRGKMFTKIIRELIVAARMGGGDPESNPRLRKAITDARAVNMPADNIKKAIQRGTGEIEGEKVEELFYEGYGPGGVAVYLQVMTDNRNRTVSEIRHIFSKNGGNLGESGCVSWMFSRKGYIVVEREKIDEDKLIEIVLDKGGDDVRIDGSNFEVITPPEAYEDVLNALKSSGVEPASSEIGFIPQNYVKLKGKEAEQMLRLMEALEEHDDVQHVWANFDIEEEEIAKYEEKRVS